MDVMTGVAAGEPTGEDAVLLREFCHRAANDCAVALAALRMVEGAGFDDVGRRASLVRQASARIEASARLNRLLARPVPPVVDVREWLVAACGELAEAGPGGARVEVDAPETWLDGPTARRLVLVATELVVNALKYAGAGRPRVSVRSGGGHVELRVHDGGPGFAPGGRPKGGGLGTGIVADLVRIGGGRLDVRSGKEGTDVRVVFPVAAMARPGSQRVPGTGPLGTEAIPLMGPSPAVRAARTAIACS